MRAPCPNCNQDTVLSTDNPWRPFCCERCKLLDLSRWLDGAYVIPGLADESHQNPSRIDDPNGVTESAGSQKSLHSDG